MKTIVSSSVTSTTRRRGRTRKLSSRLLGMMEKSREFTSLARRKSSSRMAFAGRLTLTATWSCSSPMRTSSRPSPMAGSFTTLLRLKQHRRPSRTVYRCLSLPINRLRNTSRMGPKRSCKSNILTLLLCQIPGRNNQVHF